VRDITFYGGNKNFRVCKFPGRLKVGWREGAVLGREEGRMRRSRLLQAMV
jgi:hypothetical protein